MAFTDDEIRSILESPKRVQNPKARMKTVGKHTQVNYDVESGGGDRFLLYVRQSLLIGDGFSCGLVLQLPDGQKLALVRYNGPDHTHGNPLENENIRLTAHIHKATSRYILSAYKDDRYAEKTNRYSDVSGALGCILRDCNISGLKENSGDRSKQLGLLNDGNNQ